LFTYRRAKPAKTPLEKQKIPTSINTPRKQQTEIITIKAILAITLNTITATSKIITILPTRIQIRLLTATADTISTR
jgi:hypothetical protein